MKFVMGVVAAIVAIGLILTGFRITVGALEVPGVGSRFIVAFLGFGVMTGGAALLKISRRLQTNVAERK